MRKFAFLFLKSTELWAQSVADQILNALFACNCLRFSLFCRRRFAFCCCVKSSSYRFHFANQKQERKIRQAWDVVVSLQAKKKTSHFVACRTFHVSSCRCFRNASMERSFPLSSFHFRVFFSSFLFLFGFWLDHEWCELIMYYVRLALNTPKNTTAKQSASREMRKKRKKEKL